MTVRVERTFELEASPERVWEFIADPAKRARPISVVESFDVHDDTHATWHISLPIPLVSRTIAVETEDTAREPPEHVEFVVDGRLPGVEGFFKRNLDGELDNLETAIRNEAEIEA